MSDDDEPCPSCGAPGVGGLDGCRAVFDQVVGREFGEPALYASHRLTVDAYSLQHPDAFMTSTKSAAAHLAGMCWSLEHGKTLHMPAPIKAWVDGARTFARLAPPPPGARGAVTVRALEDIVDAADYEVAARAWATSAWEAWTVHHAQARAWVEEALSEYGKRRAAH